MRLRALIGFGLCAALLAGCQSTQPQAGSRRDQLARICADPAARRPDPGNIYYDECRQLYPPTNRQLSHTYFRQAPTAEEN